MQVQLLEVLTPLIFLKNHNLNPKNKMRRFFNIKTTLAGLGAAIGYLFSTQNPYDKVNIGTAICMLLTGFFAKDVTPVEVDSRPINPPKINN